MSRETRKTRDGRYVLRPGEYERKGQKGFIYKWRDDTGRQCSVSALTLKELRDKKEQVQKDRLDGLKRTRQRKTLNDYFEIWKKQKSGLEANTYSNYVYMYERFVRDSVIGRKELKDLTKSDIKTFYKNLRDGKRKGRKQDSKPVAVNTLDVLQNVLHQILDLAVEDDAIRRNVSDKALKELKAESPVEKKEALTLEEQARFMEVIKDTPWEPVFTLMLWTGMRVGEVTGLTWDDIDEAEGIIHVRRTLVYYKDQDTGKMERRINTTKTTAGFRDLPMNDIIREVLKKQKEIGIPCKAEVDGVKGFIFATRFGDTQGQHTLNRALKRIVDTANADADASVLLPRFSCHILRHTYDTNLIRAGVSHAVIMDLMGHKDVQMTLGTYASIQKDMKISADEALQAYLNSGSEQK